MQAGDKIKILNYCGIYEPGYQVIDIKPDKHGLISIKHIDSSEIYQIHPKRVFEPDAAEKTTITTKTKPQKQIKQPNTIDYDELKTIGELWTKSSIDFDGSTDVKTHCLINIKHKRYLSFNTYNNTYGKKGKTPQFQELMNGDKVGYEITNLDKLYKKLKTNGYTKQ